MSYPERGASYRNKPAWLDRAVAGEKRADGGSMGMASPNMVPTDPTITPEEVKTWGTPDNARAAARARENARDRTGGTGDNMFKNEAMDTGDRMEDTPSESNKPSFLRGKKPL